MKYEDLPQKNRLALNWYIGCLKEKKTDIDYEVYESPSLFIIYLDDDVFDDLEDNIDEILDSEYTSSQYPTIDKGILFAPKKFMASYEEKIEGWPYINTECSSSISGKNISVSNDFIGYKNKQTSLYLYNDVFDAREDKNDKILDSNLINSQFSEINEEVLFATKEFMTSYEEKIVRSGKNISVSNDFIKYNKNKPIGGINNECNKAA